MFGFSLSKVLLTILAVFVIWRGFKWYGRVQELREQVRGAGQTAPEMRRRPASRIEEMVHCSACGTYVAASRPARCGRGDCPFPG